MPIHRVKLVRNSVIDRPSNPFNFDIPCTGTARLVTASRLEFSIEASRCRTVPLIKTSLRFVHSLAASAIETVSIVTRPCSKEFREQLRAEFPASRNCGADSSPSGSYRRFSALNSLGELRSGRAPPPLAPFHSARNSPRWIGYLRYCPPRGVFSRGVSASVFTRYPIAGMNYSQRSARILPVAGYARTGRTASERTD